MHARALMWHTEIENVEQRGAEGREPNRTRTGSKEDDMGHRSALLVATLVFLTTAVTPAEAVDVIAPLERQPPPVATLFRPTEQAVAVRVVDQRAEKNLIGGGVMGPGVEKGSGIYLIYATETSGEIAAHFEAAAADAVKILGFKAGDGGLTLEIVLRDLWVDMYRMSGFGMMNCIAYLSLQTKLGGPEVPEPRVRDLRLTFWEDTVPVGSMKEVAKGAVSAIYSQAAWQAVAEAILDGRDLPADEEGFARVLAQLDSSKDEVAVRKAIFWLGIARHPSPAVKEKLLAILGSSKERRHHQAASEALGLLGVQEAAPRIQAILSGQEKGDWDVTDSEQVWYLLHGLALLGEKDLSSRIPADPKNEIKPRSKIDDLLSFHAGGPAPKMCVEAKEKLAKAKEKLATKIRD